MCYIPNVGQSKVIPLPERYVTNISLAFLVYVSADQIFIIAYEILQNLTALCTFYFAIKNYGMHFSVLYRSSSAEIPPQYHRSHCNACAQVDPMLVASVSVGYSLFMRHLHLNVPVITSWNSNEVFTVIDPANSDIDSSRNSACTCFNTAYQG